MALLNNRRRGMNSHRPLGGIFKGKFAEGITEELAYFKSTTAEDTEEVLPIPYDKETLEFEVSLPYKPKKISFSNYCRSYIERIDSFFDTSKTTTFYELFFNAKIKEFDFNLIDFSNIDNISYMFDGCSNLENIDMSKVVAPKLDSMGSCFRRALSLKTCDISFNKDNIISLQQLFYQCSALTDINFGTFDLSKCTITGSSTAFGLCNNLQNIRGQLSNIKYFDVDMSSCSKLTNESAMVLINGLGEIDTEHTITFHADVFNQLTEEQIAIATNKGWNIKSA